MGRLVIILFALMIVTACSKRNSIETDVRHIRYSTHKLSNTTIGASGLLDYEIDIFPMPFKDSTTIRLTLDQETSINLTITDEQGTFFDVVNDYFEDGTHDIVLHFNNFSEGIYMMELEIGSLGDRFQMIKVDQL